MDFTAGIRKTRLSVFVRERCSVGGYEEYASLSEDDSAIMITGTHQKGGEHAMRKHKGDTDLKLRVLTDDGGWRLVDVENSENLSTSVSFRFMIDVHWKRGEYEESMR